MLHLLDANVLIDAARDYYPLERVPEFWEWLEAMGNRGRVKMPIETHEEVSRGADLLADWSKRRQVKDALLLNEEPNLRNVQRVTDEGYGFNLTDLELEAIGQDPFLVAYCLVDSRRCVVTTEQSKPGRQRQNRHVPDVCKSLGIPSIHTFQMLRDLDFSTSWRR